MKAVVAAFKQEKALVGAFSVITNIRMDLFEALAGVGLLTYNPAHVQTKSAAQGLDVKIIVIGDQVDKDCVPFTDLVRSQLAV